MASDTGPLTDNHLRLKALVYVRQSTDFQVRNHVERQKLQYALAEHARRLGFREVVVIDEDQGVSGSGVRRRGFERLIGAVCRGEVGLVLSLEASRLARNGRDWHTLLDFCAVVGCLVGDRQRLYDPSRADDRLFLGMKGSFSEAELATFRQRSWESRLEMARRGELFGCLPAGYERVGRHGIARTPDQRQREAVGLVFRLFARLRSARQTWIWFKRGKRHLPVRTHGQGIVWKVPTYGCVHGMLTNPIYAGAYAWGRRRGETVIENGRRRVRYGIRKPEREWTVLLLDRHTGYISWREYQRNQAVIAGNRTARQGAARSGRALLSGLLRCGHCRRRMQVRDNGRSAGYQCRGDFSGEDGVCLGFGAVKADAAVRDAALELLQPLGVEAALRAWEGRGEEARAEERLARTALEEARYRSGRAQAQFNAVEPENANVVRNLAHAWERALEEERGCEERLLELEARRGRAALGQSEREAYLALGEDLERAWNHRRATPELRKAVLRTVLVEVTALREEDRILLRMHWKGGDHSETSVTRLRTGMHRWTTDKSVVEVVRSLARTLPDAQIVALLNRLGKRTGKGNGWSLARVRSLRSTHKIAVHRAGERRERGELVLVEAAAHLGVGPHRVYRLIEDGILPARQVCRGAPWVIMERDLDAPQVREALSGRSRPAADPKQETLDFEESEEK